MKKKLFYLFLTCIVLGTSSHVFAQEGIFLTSFPDISVSGPVGNTASGTAIFTVGSNSGFIDFSIGSTKSAYTVTGVSGPAPYTWNITDFGDGSFYIATYDIVPANTVVTFNYTIKVVDATVANYDAGDAFSIGASNLYGGVNVSTTFGKVFITEASTPVRLTSFSTKLYSNNVQLDWSTASELNNSFFEIQHSVNGRDFEAIGNVAGKGTSSEQNTYTFTHYAPNPSYIHYYRLKQVDSDGKYELSTVKSAQFDSYVGIDLKATILEGRNIRAFINYGDESLSDDVTLSLLDVSGKKLSSQTLKLQKNTLNTADFYSSEINSGLYFIRLENSSKVSTVRVALP